eukprot:TRINITY_DN5289_c0_g4_i3.p1 TRINITY_DN5289_c0_g4~~TRINITY_DN5289_c0_g4_i3.p1  ORF type:complete len:312 (+),score=23.05 TRINITY_DN5289_c0_g4_i3:68-1003(+)
MESPHNRSTRDASSVPCACDPTDFKAQMRIASVAWLNDSTLEEPQCPQNLSDVHDVLPSEWQGKTSVMVRNIPYKCTRPMFFEAVKRAGFENLYDYAYMPLNAGRATSKGYAFLNFSDDITAYRFKVHFDGKKMDVPKKSKLLEVIPANLQGYLRNEAHYITKQHELLIEWNNIEPAESHQSNCSNEDCETSEDADRRTRSIEQPLGFACDAPSRDILGESKWREVLPSTSQSHSQDAQHVMKPGGLLSTSKDTKPAGWYQSGFSYQGGEISEHVDYFPYSRVQHSSYTCNHCYREALPGATFCQWCGAHV